MIWIHHTGKSWQHFRPDNRLSGLSDTRYQVGNTSSNKITKVKHFEPRLALGWVTFQGLDVDGVAINAFKKPRSGEKVSPFYAPGATKLISGIRLDNVTLKKCQG